MNKDCCPLSAEELTALRQTLDFLRDQEGKAHKGYFWSGWAGHTLRDLLSRCSADKAAVVRSAESAPEA